MSPAHLDPGARRHYISYMISEVFKCGDSLALRLPKELRPREGKMQIEASGDCWIVSPVDPVKKAAWPKGFFARIRLSDPDSFQRPSQGELRPGK